MRKSEKAEIEWERELSKNPNCILETLKSLATRATRGDKQAANDLIEYVANHPEFKSAIRELEPFTDKVETVWIRAVSFGDVLVERVTRDEITSMKAELITPNANILQKVLLSTLVVAYLNFQHAAVLAAIKEASPSVLLMRDKRLTAAQKRLAAAIKAWNQIVDTKSKGKFTHPTLKMFEPG